VFACGVDPGVRARRLCLLESRCVRRGVVVRFESGPAGPASPPAPPAGRRGGASGAARRGASPRAGIYVPARRGASPRGASGKGSPRPRCSIRTPGQGEGNSPLARRQERCATEAEGAARDPPCPGRLAKPRAAEWCRAGAFFREKCLSTSAGAKVC